MTDFATHRHRHLDEICTIRASPLANELKRPCLVASQTPAMRDSQPENRRLQYTTIPTAMHSLGLQRSRRAAPLLDDFPSPAFGQEMSYLRSSPPLFTTFISAPLATFGHCFSLRRATLRNRLLPPAPPRSVTCLYCSPVGSACPPRASASLAPFSA